MSICNGMELLKLTTCKKRLEIECLFFIECLHKVALGAFKRGCERSRCGHCDASGSCLIGRLVSMEMCCRRKERGIKLKAIFRGFRCENHVKTHGERH